MANPPTNPTATGCFTEIGVFAVVAFCTLLVLGLTALVPPWVRVECQRRQVLYWSEQVQVYSRSFAGYDWLFAGPNWQRVPESGPRSEAYFDAVEYQVFWPVLLAEWVVILVLAGVAYVAVFRRIRLHPGPSMPANTAKPGDEKG